MTEIVTSSSMRRQGKPIHGTSSEAPGNRKSRATDRMFLPTRRLCLTLHVGEEGRVCGVIVAGQFGEMIQGSDWLAQACERNHCVSITGRCEVGRDGLDSNLTR